MMFERLGQGLKHDIAIGPSFQGLWTKAAVAAVCQDNRLWNLEGMV
jgi:hypothetical protein